MERKETLAGRTSRIILDPGDVHSSTKRRGGRDSKFKVSKETWYSSFRTHPYIYVCISYVYYVHTYICIYDVAFSSSVCSDGPRDTVRPLIFQRAEAVSFLLSSSRGRGDRGRGKRWAPKMLPRPQTRPVLGSFLGEASLKWLLTTPKNYLPRAQSVLGLLDSVSWYPRHISTGQSGIWAEKIPESNSIFFIYFSINFVNLTFNVTTETHLDRSSTNVIDK